MLPDATQLNCLLKRTLKMTFYTLTHLSTLQFISGSLLLCSYPVRTYPSFLLSWLRDVFSHY